VFVYANGDSGRSRDLATDLARMSKARLTADVKVIVLADWNAALTGADGRPFPSGSEWIALSGAGAQAIVGREAEQDLDAPDVVRRSVARAFRDHPAEHHGLIVWSRSGAGDVDDGRRPGAEPISVPALKTAIRDGLADAGLTGERALDFLGFDGFAPARVEVAYALRDLAQVQVANCARASGSSWAYEDALSFLAEHEDATGPSFAAFEAAAAEKVGPRSHAAIVTAGLDDVATATSELIRTVVENPVALPAVVSAVQTTVLDATSTGRPPSYRRFVAELASKPSVSAMTAAANDVLTRLSQTLVGPDDGSELAITLPLASSESGTNADDAAKEWQAATGWDALMTSLVGYAPSSNEP